MRILLLSFYYRPDLSAGSFRATSLVQALQARGRHDLHVDVVTTLPNRYVTYSAEASETEEHGGVRIHRVRLPRHSSDMLGQARAFVVYARAAQALTRPRKYDLVVATSSRLMTAALGASIARRCGARLYLDIRDIFVDTIADVLPGPAMWPARLLFDGIERRTMSRANRINLVSPGFTDYFRSRYPQARLSCLTNGIDDEFVAAAASIDSTRRPARPARVLYAGNLGEGQGLHAILPGLAQRMRGKASFTVIGDGGRRKQLAERLAALAVDNVELRPPVGRAQLIGEYQAADVLFLHLNSYAAFAKVLPSKIFEYGAMGKPIWAGVAGFAASFIAAEVSNARVFRPCDDEAAERAFGQLELVDRRREEFVRKYSRATLADQLAQDILSTAGETRPQ